MKIILDESAPQKLRLLIDSRHTVVTTWFQGWSGLKNGELVLSTNNWSVVKEQVAEITAAINAATPGSFAFVEIGHGRG
jgi:hypothetical protein